MHGNVVQYRRRNQKPKDKGVRKIFWLLLLPFMVLILAAIYLISPFALVESVVIQGNEQVSQEEIMTVAGLEVGMHLWRFSIAESMDKLMTNPWLSEVVIKRNLPQEVQVYITERQALAIIPPNEDRNGLIIASDGMILEEGLDRSLPWITGLTGEGFKPGQLLQGDDLKAALELAQALEPIGWQISEINVAMFPSAMTVFTTDGFKIFMKPTQPQDRFYDLLVLLDKFRGDGVTGIIDLRPEGRGNFQPWPAGEGPETGERPETDHGEEDETN